MPATPSFEPTPGLAFVPRKTSVNDDRLPPEIIEVFNRYAEELNRLGIRQIEYSNSAGNVLTVAKVGHNLDSVRARTAYELFGMMAADMTVEGRPHQHFRGSIGTMGLVCGLLSVSGTPQPPN